MGTRVTDSQVRPRVGIDVSSLKKLDDLVKRQVKEYNDNTKLINSLSKKINSLKSEGFKDDDPKITDLSDKAKSSEERVSKLDSNVKDGTTALFILNKLNSDQNAETPILNEQDNQFVVIDNNTRDVGIDVGIKDPNIRDNTLSYIQKLIELKFEHNKNMQSYLKKEYLASARDVIASA